MTTRARRARAAAGFLLFCAAAILCVGAPAGGGQVGGSAPTPQSLNQTEVVPGPVPASALANYTIELTFDVMLSANETPANISATEVSFDAVSHGPYPYNAGDYAQGVAGVLVSGTTYTANISWPTPTTLYVIFGAVVSGTAYYNVTEWTIEVRSVPVVTLEASASDAVVVIGEDANLTAHIEWPYLDNLSEISLLWDTVSHEFPWNVTQNYTVWAQNFSGPAGNFTFRLATPPGGAVYFAFSLRASGGLVLSQAEYLLRVVSEPIATRDGSPPWVFAGRNATIRWSVFADASLSYTTELRWDSVSHPAPRTFAAYPQSSGLRSGTGTNSYSQTVDTPTAGWVYFLFVIHWNSRDIYVTSLNGTAVEYKVEVRPPALLLVPAPPTVAFVGYNVTVSANFTWAYPDVAESLSLVYDNAGHGSPPASAAAYGNEVVRANVSAGGYSFTMDAPASPGTLYFAVLLRIGGLEFLSADEYQVAVAPVPVLLLTLPNWTLPQAVATASLAVNWPTGGALDSVALYHDAVPHGGALDPARYANSTPPQSGVPGTFSFTFTTPNNPGTLYVLAAVEISSYMFTTAAEATLPVADPPMVVGPTLDPAMGFAINGQSMEVSWTVNFTYAVQVSSDFRWDSSSHAGPGMTFSDYPQASALLTQLSTTTFTTTFTAPNTTGPIHGIVRVLLLGRNFYSAQEVNVTVLPTPVLELVSYPHQVDVNKPIEIAWRVNMTGPSILIPHTSIHWGLVSKAPLPPLLTNYPGVGSPYGGIHSTSFNTTLPSQPSPGHVYFIVHVVVNGLHYYLPDEYTIDVVLPGGGGGNGFLPGPDAAAALIAIAAAVFVAGLRRNPRRD